MNKILRHINESRTKTLFRIGSYNFVGNLSSSYYFLAEKNNAPYYDINTFSNLESKELDLIRTNNKEKHTVCYYMENSKHTIYINE